jgi:hypothetical protein
MTPTTCDLCRHFQRDHINPEAGMGRCLIGLGMWHPMAPHRCAKREASDA